MFPNILLVGDEVRSTFQFRVPADDTHTYHVSYYVWRPAPGAQAPRQESIPYRYVPLKDENDRYINDILFNQDYLAWVTQGPVAKRHLEKLGESDKGIILFPQAAAGAGAARRRRRRPDEHVPRPRAEQRDTPAARAGEVRQPPPPRLRARRGGGAHRHGNRERDAGELGGVCAACARRQSRRGEPSFWTTTRTVSTIPASRTTRGTTLPFRSACGSSMSARLCEGVHALRSGRQRHRAHNTTRPPTGWQEPSQS